MLRIDLAILVAWVSLSSAIGEPPPGGEPRLSPSRAEGPSQAIGSVAQQAYLKASNSQAGDQFGGALAVSGDTVVVGARFDASSATGVNGDQADNSLIEAGAAYVFVRDGGGWSQQAYLKASNAGLGDSFGGAVAISGDTIVITAVGEDSGATGVNGDQSDNGTENSGAAYVFVRNGTSWSQEAYLKASNTGASDNFGLSVSIAGDTIVVGSREEDSSATGVNGDQGNDAAPISGAAYVFVRNGSSWTQQAYLKASNTSTGDSFGWSVSISGDTVVVGAIGEDSDSSGVNGDQGNNSLNNSGASYVFVRSGSSWTQQAYLKASNTGDGDFFGGAVSISGDTVVVGATAEDSGATGVNGNQGFGATSSGAAYVFVRSGARWSQQAYVKASNTGTGDLFGTSLSVAGEVLMVGASSEDSNATGVGGNQSNNSKAHSGAAYLFVRVGTAWSQQAYLKASNTGGTDWFGRAVAVSGCTAVAGAWLEDSNATGVDGNQGNNGAADSGAVYVFSTQAGVAFRNAGSNPASYSASPVVIGGTFTATVDNNLASQVASLLFAFESPISVTLGSGQTLLCLDLGSGELFTGGNLAPTSSSGGVDSYSVAVPDDPALCGFSFSSQAIQFGSPPFDLSNAQDFTVGSF